MNDSASGEVQETQVAQSVHAENWVPAPRPTTLHRVDKSGHYHCEGEEGKELHSLGHGTGHNGHCSGNKNHLKKEVRNLEAELEEATADLQRMESTLADEKTYSELAPDELTELLTRAGTKRRALERVEENWLEAVARLESHDEN